MRTPNPGSMRGFLPRSHPHASGAATVARRPAPSGRLANRGLTRRSSTRSDTKPGAASHKATRYPKLSTKIGSCTHLPTLCMVRAITPSAGRVRETAADVRLHVGQDLRIRPLSGKWSTVSGRGRGAGDAPTRLHRTPLGPEGRAVRPGRHIRPGPFRARLTGHRSISAFIRTTSQLVRLRQKLDGLSYRG
jgi:hypothetical protein